MKFKRILILLMPISMILSFGFSQSTYSSLQDVVPPSPEAISFALQTFSDVNLYTGKLSYSIPIHSLNGRGIGFPVALSYSGGNGIKVEEVASSVGLGWSLQSTGVISRVARGGTDDRYYGSYIGYIHLPGIDTTYNNIYSPEIGIYETNYDEGKYDSQPDLYILSAPGLSASFYINKYKDPVFIEKSDYKIRPIFSGFTISAFEVKDLDGNIFLFDVTETTKSAPRTTYSEYNLYDVSAWYLSKITTPDGEVALTFEYADKDENESHQVIRSPFQFYLSEYPWQTYQPFEEGEAVYADLYTKRPVLRKISSPLGTVNFVASSSVRCDLANDHYLDSIVVKNYQGEILREFNFDYSYFTDTGVIQEGQAQSCAEGNPVLRLKLDRLEIISGDNPNQKETYNFEYNTSILLPDKLSTFAMDHWGYYNGANSNVTWEAKNRTKYYAFGLEPNGDPILRLDEFGTANREPNAAYSKACILEKIVTPASGEYQFEYEGHTSSSPKLPNSVSTIIIEYTLNDSSNYFDVNLIREPFAFVKVQALIDEGVSIEYKISDSLDTMIPIIDTLIEGSSNQTHKLQNGTYYIKAKILQTHPDPDYNYGPRIIKDIETPILNKPVGGVRIKEMRLVDPVSDQSYSRKYYYNNAGADDPNSPSTGTIGSVPKYGSQHIQMFFDSTLTSYNFTINGYGREMTSTYPLVSTSGSHVGYSKVTVVENDTFKTETTYTSFDKFPECADGYHGEVYWMISEGYLPPPLQDSIFVLPYDPDNIGVFINGEWFETWPYAPFDDRDFYRGKLLSETKFKSQGDTFAIVSKLENFYIHNFGLISPMPGLSEAPEVYEYVTGMVTMGQRNLQKSFRLHTGRVDLSKRISTQYSESGIIASTTEFDYGQSPWNRGSHYHYQSTKVVTLGSQTIDSTKFYYPFDWRYSVPDIGVADTSYLAELERQNRIGTPVIQKKYSNGVHDVTTKNIYDSFGNVFNPSVIQVKSGAETSFEDRIYFEKYDTLGNIVQQKKAFDTKALYMWDYKSSLPVAQIVNADSADVAYTSFEAESKGNWSYTGSPSTDTSAPTGDKYLDITGSISKTGLDSGRYIVSYWKKSGTVSITSSTVSTGETVNGWTFYEHEVDVTGTVSLSCSSAKIDELRLYPVGAQMTTYTHTPLVGVSEVCDPNNRISHYEYDGFGRLQVVRDHDGNILKTYKYHYKGQAE